MELLLSSGTDEPFPYKEYLMEKKEGGRLIVGILGHEMIPLEILRCFNVHVVHLNFVGPEEYTNEGGMYLTPSFCTYARNVLGMFMDVGSNWVYDHMDLLIRTSYCNGDFCSIEYISRELDIPSLYLPIPFKITRHSIQYFKDEFNEFLSKLEGKMDEQLSIERLRAQIKIHEHLRSTLRNLHGLGVSNTELLSRYQEASILSPEDMVRRLEVLYPGISTNSSSIVRNGSDEPRIIVTGDPIFINDIFGNWLEMFGANVVYFDTWMGGLMEDFSLGDGLDVGDESLVMDVVEKYVTRQGAGRNVRGSNESRVSRIKHLVKAFDAKGIINHTLKFCDIQTLDRNGFKDQLNHIVPVLDIERDYSKGSRGTLQTRVEAFIELIKDGLN
ncbi:MAG: 2-hydroxyacyl-CoA dehydratase family protein [Promethearchaeota archaeon]